MRRAWLFEIMDPFRRCLQDLESIARLVELPNGREIALEMFRELSPYLEQLATLKEQDRSGALACLLDYAEGMRIQLHEDKLASGVQPNMRPAPRVA